jgi:hypothetical protein
MEWPWTPPQPKWHITKSGMNLAIDSHCRILWCVRNTSVLAEQYSLLKLHCVIGRQLASVTGRKITARFIITPHYHADSHLITTSHRRQSIHTLCIYWPRQSIHTLCIYIAKYPHTFLPRAAVQIAYIASSFWLWRMPTSSHLERFCETLQQFYSCLLDYTD